MPQKLTPHAYQDDAFCFGIKRCLYSGNTGGGTAFFHDPGMGKTVVSLLLIRALKSMGRLKQTILIAPLRPIYSVWPAELHKWLDFHGLTYRIVHGDEEKRVQALKSNADILLINAEGVQWLVKYLITQELWKIPLPRVLSQLSKMDTELKPLVTEVKIKGDVSLICERLPPARWKTLVKNLGIKIPPEWHHLLIDESSLFKNPDSQRFQSLQAIALQFPYRTLLTGTPSPNGLTDLWAQIFILDGGLSLGRNITTFRKRYFNKGFRGSSWNIKDGAKEQIYQAVGHLVHRLDENDHLDLPPLVYNDIWVDLNSKAMKGYKLLEKEMFIELQKADVAKSFRDMGIQDEHFNSTLGMERPGIVLGTAAAKYGNCRGFANGGVYETPENEFGEKQVQNRVTHHIHDDKVRALSELIGELQGKPLIVAYQFKHDLARILKKYPKAPAINGDTDAAGAMQLINQWNAGAIDLLLVQPQSMSHGVNMQANGNDICWFGLTDNLEIYLQLNKRLHRQGVTSTVRIHRLLCRDTIEEAILARLGDKDSTQQALLRALQNYRLHSV